MRLVIAPDSFKGCLTASQAAEAMARGWRAALPEWEIDTIPMADGGEGTLQSLMDATGGETKTATVCGPLGQPVEAQWGVLGDGKTAVIEMAQAAGLPQLSIEQRNPLQTTSWGVGELILAALDYGAQRCLIGLGGSATVDGAVGLLMALGAAFFDKEGQLIEPTGQGMCRAVRADLSGLDPRLRECELLAAYDVTNPLLGSSGAAQVYGPQKGASPEQVIRLEEGLSRLAQQMVCAGVAALPGSGAAGGMGAGLAGFLGARLTPGVDLVAHEVHLEERLRGANLVLTGEGEINFQSASGKTPVGVAKYAARCGVPVVAVTGRLGEGWRSVLQCGIAACFSLSPGPIALEECCASAETFLADCTEQIAYTLSIGGRIDEA